MFYISHLCNSSCYAKIKKTCCIQNLMLIFVWVHNRCYFFKHMSSQYITIKSYPSLVKYFTWLFYFFIYCIFSGSHCPGSSVKHSEFHGVKTTIKMQQFSAVNFCCCCAFSNNISMEIAEY